MVAQALLFIICTAAWLFMLRVLKNAELRFWHFLVGAVGLFVLAMVFVRPWATMPLAQTVSALAGIVGSVTGAFTSYFRYAVIFVPTDTSSITLQVDLECSGIIEIMAFVSLLAFFDVYKRPEKILVGVIGVAIIMLANALRIVLICEIVHFFGVGAFSVAHTYIGRLFFYAITVLLYFYVFTKPQVVSMKVGGFLYGDSAKSA
jgi:exosortase family protein XrtG